MLPCVSRDVESNTYGKYFKDWEFQTLFGTSASYFSVLEWIGVNVLSCFQELWRAYFK